MWSATSIAKSTWQMYSVLQKNAQNNTSSSGTTSTLFSSLTTSSAQNETNDPLALDWSTFLSKQKQSSGKDLASILSKRISSQKDDIASLETYSKNSTAFYQKFSNLSTSLKKSASDLEKTDFTRPADTTAATKQTAAIVDKVKAFAADYNAMGQFFQDNQSLSNSVKGLSISFSDAKYKARSYAAIGISTDSKGQLSIDEKKLTTALQTDSSSVAKALGKGGLSSTAIKKTNSALSMTGQLYPALQLKNSSNILNSNQLLAGMMVDFYY